LNKYGPNLLPPPARKESAIGKDYPKFLEGTALLLSAFDFDFDWQVVTLISKRSVNGLKHLQEEVTV